MSMAADELGSDLIQTRRVALPPASPHSQLGRQATKPIANRLRRSVGSCLPQTPSKASQIRLKCLSLSLEQHEV